MPAWVGLSKIQSSGQLCRAELQWRVSILKGDVFLGQPTTLMCSTLEIDVVTLCGTLKVSGVAIYDCQHLEHWVAHHWCPRISYHCRLPSPSCKSLCVVMEDKGSDRQKVVLLSLKTHFGRHHGKPRQVGPTPTSAVLINNTLSLNMSSSVWRMGCCTQQRMTSYIAFEIEVITTCKLILLGFLYL